MIRLMCAVVLLMVSGSYASAQTASSDTHTVGPGDSLYNIVAQHYPERMSRWTDVAADLVALNPDTFPQGLDTVMRLDDVLILVDYTTPEEVSSSTVTAPPGGQRDIAPNAIDNATAPAAKAPVSTAPERVASPQPDETNRAIGYVVSIDSQAFATDHENQQRSLAPNDRIYFGDAVSTQAFSTVLIRMLDNAEFQIQPASRLMFERYQYDADTHLGSATLTLIKGGFRSTTGLLSQHQPDAVAVNTAVATVGIRGTEFALRVCARDTCRTTQNSAALAPGLYSGVLEGSIVLSNNTGDLETGRGEFFHVAAPNTVPEAAPDAASLLFNKRELVQLDVVIEEEQPLSFLGWIKHKLFGD